MKKFHVSKNGDIRPCNAKKRACRFGDHFATEQAAKDFIESKNSGQPLLHTSRKLSKAEEILKRFENLKKCERGLVLAKLKKDTKVPEGDGAEHMISKRFQESLWEEAVKDWNKEFDKKSHNAQLYLALKRYTDYSVDINEYNRRGTLAKSNNGVKLSKEAIEEIKRDTELLREVISIGEERVKDVAGEKAVKKYYRGINFDSLREVSSSETHRMQFETTFKEGSIFENAAFMSTTRDPSIAREFGTSSVTSENATYITTLEIYSTPKMKISGERIDIGGEEEFLFNKDETFIVGEREEIIETVDDYPGRVNHKIYRNSIKIYDVKSIEITMDTLGY